MGKFLAPPSLRLDPLSIKKTITCILPRKNGLRLSRFGCMLLCDPGDFGIAEFILLRHGTMENLYPSASGSRSGTEKWKYNIH